MSDSRPSAPVSHANEAEHRRQLANIINLINQSTPDYRRTDSEISAGVTPVDYRYPEGDVRRYGAVGDGTTDDTAAIQKALDSGVPRIVFPAGSYLISHVEARTEGQTIVCDPSAWLITNTTDAHMILITAPSVTVRLNVDGNNVAACGIEVEELGANYLIEHCHVKNIRSETRQAFGILVRAPGGGIVRNNLVENIFSLGNGQTGDGPGLSRCIQYLPRKIPTGAMVIEGNVVKDCHGEEGDMIAVQNTPSDWNGTHPYPDGRCTILNNYGENWTRRFMKIQSSGVYISGNVARCFTELGGGAQQQGCIAIIASDECVVEGNVLDCHSIAYGLNTSGSGVHINKRVIVRNNTVLNPAGWGIQIRESQYCEASNNTLIDDSSSTSSGQIIVNGPSHDIIVKGNVFLGEAGNTLIDCASDCQRIHITGNENKMTSAERFINAPCVDSVVCFNVSTGELTNGVIGLHDPNSDGSVVRFNTAFAATTSLIINAGSADYNDLGNISL